MIQEAITLITRLAEHFKIATPNMVMCLGEKSLYHNASHTIFLASHPWRGLTDSILHEFSHALANNRHPSQGVDRGDPPLWRFTTIRMGH